MGNISVVTDKKIGWARIILSALIAVIVSLALILVFALLIKWFEWGDGVIAPVNIIIKILSIGVGVVVATKGGNRSLVKGSLVGILYIILSFLLFSLLLGSITFSMQNMWDLLFGVIVGAIVGVICNVFKK